LLKKTYPALKKAAMIKLIPKECHSKKNRIINNSMITTLLRLNIISLLTT